MHEINWLLLRKRQNHKGAIAGSLLCWISADRISSLESVQDVTIALSRELCRCLRLFQPQLLQFHGFSPVAGIPVVSNR